MDFMTGLFLSVDWKNDSYDSILIIIDCLTKIVYYELVKVIINTQKLAKAIINVVVQYHDLPDSIISDYKTNFISKF